MSLISFTRFCLALIVLFSSPALVAQSVIRGPYLQLGTATSVMVKWRTDVATQSEVRYGLTPGSLTGVVQSGVATTEHALALTGLLSDEKYYYSVGNFSGPMVGGDASHYFVTSPPAGTPTPTRVWVLGDSGTANANAAAVRDAFLNYTGDRPPNLWLMLGDNAYPDGTDAEYEAAVFDMYPVTLRQSVLWPTLGNHDGHTADSATQSGPYYDIFSLPDAGQAGGLASGTEAYYSFDYGNIHFICLESHDTDRSTSGAMMTWLANDIQATDKEWIIAYWHHPPYSKGSHDSDTAGKLIDMRENALPILESWGVDLVLTGHSHSYERSFLLDGHYGSSGSLTGSMLIDGGDGRTDGDGAYSKPLGQGAANEGAVYAVAGSSGKISGGPLNHPAMFISMNTLGSMVLDVYGNRLDAVFLDDNAEVGDYFTLIKGQDTLAPVILSTDALDFTTVSVLYAEPVEPISAENASNYGIDQGVTVLSAALQADGRTVVLTTSTLTAGFNYTLSVDNVQDLAGNPIAPGTQASFSFEAILMAQFQDGVFPSSGYVGTRDTYISENSPNSNFGSAGVLVADGNDPGGSQQDLSSLMAWDVSAVPSDATVQSASITINATNSGGVYRLFEALRPWMENEATWNAYASGLGWQLPGAEGAGDRGSVVLGDISTSGTGIHTVDLNPDGVAVVQGWVDGTIPNRGLVLADSSSTNGLDFTSREGSTPSSRPMLSIDYTGPLANNVPSVSITAPASGSTFNPGDSIAFTGSANDTEDGDISANLSWTSDIDGAIGGGGTFSTSTLSVGAHTISASVTDSGGLSGSDVINLTVNADPTVSITAPTNGASFVEGESITFSGTADDNDEGDISSNLSWTSSLDGAIGDGAFFSTALSVGTHTITASVTDSGGLNGS
ncbi:MAG: DNRLRE domain-containing protein, partial [Gammaproteobacteria bacterium]|nr:DNRLRE domain-containing protein [Gammaproteobacteria bacterium]